MPDTERRTVVWFSAGAPSAVAAKLTLASEPGPIVIAYTDPGSEHPDNQRFIRQKPYGDYSPGRFAWLLADIKPLPEPIPAKGKQGLWNWTPDE